MSLERKSRKLQARHKREDDETTAAALTDLLSTAHGRRFLWLQLSAAGVFTNPFDKDSRVTAFRCGEHNAGLRLLDLITRTHPDSLPVLMKENANVDARRRIEAERLREQFDARDGDGDAEGWDSTEG